MPRWIAIDRAAAEEHPLYGMRGWLRVCSIFVMLLAIGGVLQVVQDWVPSSGAQPPGARRAALGHNLVLLLMAAVYIVAAILWFRRWPHFRIAFAIAIGAVALIGVGGLAWTWQAAQALPPWRRSLVEDQLAGEAAAGLANLAFLMVIFLYMQRSRRYRVTFEQRLRRDDQALGASAA